MGHYLSALASTRLLDQHRLSIRELVALLVASRLLPTKVVRLIILERGPTRRLSQDCDKQKKCCGGCEKARMTSMVLGILIRLSYLAGLWTDDPS